MLTDFPNITTLYGWYLNGAGSANLTNFVGGLDLTLGTGALTAQIDHLGNTTYCGFNGSTYLGSSNAAFNFTGSFSIGMRVYKSSWAAVGASQVIVSCYDGANGWRIFLGTDGYLYFETRSAGVTSQAFLKYTELSGWNYISFARTSGSNCIICLNGCQIFRFVDASDAITASSPVKFQIGAENGANNYFTGSISEITVHNGTIYTDSNIRKIYSRGANILGYTDTNGIFQTIPAIQNIGYQVPIYVSDSNWTQGRAIGVIYYTIDGTKRFRFNLTGSYSGNPTSGTLKIGGITFKNIGSWDQAVTTYPSASNWCKAYASPNTTNIGWSSGAAISELCLSGDVEIE